MVNVTVNWNQVRENTRQQPESLQQQLSSTESWSLTDWARTLDTKPLMMQAAASVWASQHVRGSE